MIRFKLFVIAMVLSVFGCKERNLKPADIFGNPNYRAIAFGGYRNTDRSVAPSVEELKEDLRILQALDIKLLRTYHARLYNHTPNLLKAIAELKAEDSSFEMYVMLGAWMQCENAWTESPNHAKGDEEENWAEINQVANLANRYPTIVKALAVGNEAMVHWAAGYFVPPRVILQGVEHLQQLKADGELPKDVWITTSDNFASWGGGDEVYHSQDLEKLIKAVDFLSVHSYPFHDTHYNPDFWIVPDEEVKLPAKEKIHLAMQRALNRVEQQLESVKGYVRSLGIEKPIHIGETGWASMDNNLYGLKGSKAADEYKQMLYYNLMREWSESRGYSCFYFEAFNEPWKDAENPKGSENHFGLITVDGRVKQVLWEDYNAEILNGLSRGGEPLRKTTKTPEGAIGVMD